MVLRIIDVSSNQGLINISSIDCDGVIAKATGGNNYTSDTCDFVIQQAIKQGKPWGFYHYAHEFGNVNSPSDEANYFIQNTKDYFSHGIPILDYEVAINGSNYTHQDAIWIHDFMQYVIDNTKVTPLLYVSKSLVTGSLDWSSVNSLSVGLWFAQYADNAPSGWNLNPWDDGKPTALPVVMHQYTSHGRINGYNGDLDLSIFYGDQQAWTKYAQGNATPTPTQSNGGSQVTQDEYLTAIARDVIAGKFGNGDERKNNIFDAVQNKVNQLL